MSANFFLLKAFCRARRETASVLFLKVEVGEGARIKDWGGGTRGRKERESGKKEASTEGAPALPAWLRWATT